MVACAFRVPRTPARMQARAALAMPCSEQEKSHMVVCIASVFMPLNSVCVLCFQMTWSARTECIPLFS
jgi:hypothetical protein